MQEWKKHCCHMKGTDKIETLIFVLLICVPCFQDLSYCLTLRTGTIRN